MHVSTRVALILSALLMAGCRRGKPSDPPDTPIPNDALNSPASLTGAYPATGVSRRLSPPDPHSTAARSHDAAASSVNATEPSDPEPSDPETLPIPTTVNAAFDLMARIDQDIVSMSLESGAAAAMRAQFRGRLYAAGVAHEDILAWMDPEESSDQTQGIAAIQAN